MPRFEVKVSKRKDDWSGGSAPLQSKPASPESGSAPVQSSPDSPETALAPLQSGIDTPEFASAPLQSGDTPEFARRNR